MTALQVDIKILGLPRPLIAEAFAGAQRARLAILDVMRRALQASRPDLSSYAPRIMTLTVKPEKIRDIIGPRGTTINKIIQETGTEITVEDDGQVFVSATNPAAIEKAVAWIRDLTREVVPGESFTGTVTRLMNFGAFVELFPGTEGLVHISEFGPGFVRRIEDVAAVGDTLSVIVREIDTQGRVNLSLPRAPAAPTELVTTGPPRERSGPRPSRPGRGPATHRSGRSGGPRHGRPPYPRSPRLR